MPILYASLQLADHIAVLMDDPEAVFDREIIDHHLALMFHRCIGPEEPRELVEHSPMKDTHGSNFQSDSGYALPDEKEATSAHGAAGTVGLPTRSDLEGVAGAGAHPKDTQAGQTERSDA